ncbi:pilus assembly PilX family protein [Motilimonas eburnea]|uniref:pilus assembly PilX family protein n=1 Tax=Motilimonas eburnea TaxID=1737488 RepID=UPI001E5B9A00|nr:collagen-binding domain-containing protein [Motilimonas eburnea]MCE2570086.1 hypothetical protein [Motilimonas eburnea]
MNRYNQQQGYVLVTVLIVTIVATLVALGGIAENRLQEQIGGNQQKEVNARMLAEKGIFNSFSYIKEQNELDSSLATIANGIPGRSIAGEFSLESVSLNGTLLSFVSKGTYQGAVAYLNAKVNVDDKQSIFEDGVVGCDGIDLSGSGKIDSYNSKNGQYGENNNAHNASVMTINSNADIALNGDAPIYGNINVNGDFSSTGSSELIGNVNAVGNINVSGGGNNRLTGDFSAGGNLTVSGLEIGGNGTIGGNIDYHSDTKINGSLTYGGDDLAGGDQSALAQSVLKDPNLWLPDFSAPPCDPMNIATQMAGFSKFNSNGTMDTNHWETADRAYEFTPDNAEMYDRKADNFIVDKAAQSLDILGESTKVHVFDNLAVKNGKINISGGDVVLVIKGDLTTSGGGPRIDIAAGSSLTIFVEGKVNIGSSGQVVAKGSITNTGKPPVSIYSSYASARDNDVGITLAGDTDMYASVYAPKSHVNVTGSGDILGALRGKTVAISGAGGMHYDEALADLQVKTNVKYTAFASLHYYYPTYE